MNSRDLALFPLQLVVFPGEDIHLHIFEPRYRQLLADCEQEGITFGIPAYINGRIREIGTEVQLTNVEKRYPDGELDITVKGMGVFRIRDYQPQLGEKLYAGGEVEDLDLQLREDPVINQEIIGKIQELFVLLKIEKVVETDPARFNTYLVGHHIGLQLEQEYELLSLFSAASRQHYVLEHLNTILPVVRQTEALKQKARLNGHFKNIIPPKA